MTPLRRTRSRGRPHPRHRFPRTALVTAAVLAVAAVVWTMAAVPALVKYPTDLDVTIHYTGTFTVLVNPADAAPLAQPLVVPLTVERHLQALADQSSSSLVVVHETITQKAGTVLDVTQTNQYVMDRSTVANVADMRSWAFSPDNVVNRAGAYRLNLPFGTQADGTYPVYTNETDATYRMAPDTATPTATVEGLELTGFTADVPEAPLTPAYLAELNRVVPLPSTLTLTQLKPHLLAAGIDVDGLLAALGPSLTPADAAALGRLAAQPIGLTYVQTSRGHAGVEPVTGVEVTVAVDEESVGARPVLTTVAPLQEILSHYPAVPQAVTASKALGDLASRPAIPLFRYRFETTPASVADVAATAAGQRRQILLARYGVPGALLLGGAVALGIGTVLYLRRRPRPLDLSTLAAPGPVPEASAAERRLTTTGPT